MPGHPDNERPTAARMVHYVSHGSPVLPDGTQRYSKQCRAAVVTAAGEHPNLASLAVLNPTGMFFDVDVERDDGDPLSTNAALCDGRDHLGGSWHWPARV